MKTAIIGTIAVVGISIAAIAAYSGIKSIDATPDHEVVERVVMEHFTGEFSDKAYVQVLAAMRPDVTRLPMVGRRVVVEINETYCDVLSDDLMSPTYSCYTTLKALEPDSLVRLVAAHEANRAGLATRWKTSRLAGPLVFLGLGSKPAVIERPVVIK